MILATNLPEEISYLWSGIKSRLESTEAPIFEWAITDEEFEQLEQFQRKYVKNGKGSYWKQDSIQRPLGRLFLIWCAEDYRRNQISRPDLAAVYMQKCGFSSVEWGYWVKKGEEALSRKTIEVGDQTRNVARIQQEAGIQRRLFEQYQAGGKNLRGEENIYWRCLLELWDRLDAPPSQILRWREDTDWYGRSWKFRAGGEGFGPAFFEYALNLLQDIRLLYQEHKPGNQDANLSLGVGLQRWFDDSDGLRQLLSDLFDERSVRKSRELSWEPQAERILYTQGSPSLWSRIWSKPKLVLPEGFKPGDSGLVLLQVEGGGCRAELAKYFSQTGQRYLSEPEIIRHPTELVSARLECGEKTLTSILLEPLDLDEVWVFEVQDSEEGAWKIRQIPTGRGPFLVSPPRRLASRAPDFELDQAGIERRQVYRFESMEEAINAGLELATGIEASYRLALRAPLQEMRVSLKGRQCAVSTGWPRSGVFGGAVLMEDSAGNWKPVPVQPPLFPVVGNFKVERRGSSGVRQRVAVLPEKFSFTVERVTDNSCHVIFDGLGPGNAPKPCGAKLMGDSWENLKIGEYLSYDWSGISLEIPVQVPGIGWSGASRR